MLVFSKPLMKLSHPQKGFSPIIILFLVMLAILVLFAAGHLLSKKEINQKPSPSITKKTERASHITHPKLYYADLEYDAGQKIAVFKGSGTTNGDYVFFDPQQPEQSPQTFVYKVKVISKDNVLLNEGWQSLFIKAIQDPQNPKKYLFKIYNTYSKGSMITVSLPDEKIIWTGVIQ